ncbi:hypothetical protein ERJ75_001755000 [Trypanosoma vivax]|nr:hypothetical protein ERJ75_001755000 [Trypanosoma vivax]
MARAARRHPRRSRVCRTAAPRAGGGPRRFRPSAASPTRRATARSGVFVAARAQGGHSPVSGQKQGQRGPTLARHLSRVRLDGQEDAAAGAKGTRRGTGEQRATKAGQTRARRRRRERQEHKHASPVVEPGPGAAHGRAGTRTRRPCRGRPLATRQRQDAKGAQWRSALTTLSSGSLARGAPVACGVAKGDWPFRRHSRRTPALLPLKLHRAP